MGDGATWGVPMNQTVYQMDKASRTLWLIAGECDDVFHRNVAAFGAVGYKVRHRNERSMATA